MIDAAAALFRWSVGKWHGEGDTGRKVVMWVVIGGKGCSLVSTTLAREDKRTQAKEKKDLTWSASPGSCIISACDAELPARQLRLIKLMRFG